MNQIRFHVYDGEHLIHTTDWVNESTRMDALNTLTDTRKRLGANFAYRIERTGDSKTPNPINQVRYRIKVGESLMYSKIFNESEKENALKEIRENFKDAVIEEVKV